MGRSPEVLVVGQPGSMVWGRDSHILDNNDNKMNCNLLSF